MQDQPPASSFGEQLRRYRKRAGLSQAELAERAALSVSAVSALERGVRTRPYPHTVRQLADALDLGSEERSAFFGPAPASSQHDQLVPEAVQQSPPDGQAVPPLPLIGRAHDLASLHALIDRPGAGRLLTLTGLGGIGKTRLACQLAADLDDAFPDGVWLVELAPVTEPERVPQAVAAVLNVREVPGTPLVDTLVTVLKPRTSLLVLDNCEQVQGVCTTLLDRLLGSCPRLKVVATSREPFRIPSEQLWRPGPLAVPADEQAATPSSLGQIASVQLFVERAQSVAPHFRLTDENAAAVAEICVRLEGIPLALELAAAWVRVLTVEQIRARLVDTLAVLTGGSRAAPRRQQTVRAALDWSYDLLSEPERTLFQRLAVFRGGCDLEIVEAVCTDNMLSAPAILELVAQLVDKSLVEVEQSGQVARYRLLEPVRQYAEQRLGEAGEADIVAARHVAAYLTLAERAAPALRGPAQIDWLQRLSLGQDNFRAALTWATVGGEAEIGLRMAVALSPFWEGRGHLSEGRRWLATVLALPETRSTPRTLQATALLRLGELAQWQAELEDAETALTASLALARAASEQPIIAGALATLGTVRRRQERVTDSIALLQESLALFRALNNQPGIAFVLLNLGVTVANGGDLGYGRALLDDSLARYRALGDLRYIAITCTMLGRAVRALGDGARAVNLLCEGLSGHLAVGDLAFIGESLRHIAALTAPSRPHNAARLLGAAETLRETLGAAEAPVTRTTDDETTIILHSQLSETILSITLAAGRALTVEQAVTEALATVEDLAGMPTATPRPQS